MKRRIACIWLPRLASEHRLRTRARTARPVRNKGHPLALTETTAFAVIAMEKSAWRIRCLNHQAEYIGVRKGMAFTDARAICPGLETMPDDHLLNEDFIARLRRWITRYSPWVAEDGTDGLLLDITGCDHLFGGEAAMLDMILGRLTRMGFTVRGAIADTVGAAWALAHYGRDATIAPPGEASRLIGPLPLPALRIDEKDVEALMRLGLRNIYQITSLPRATLARRCGLNVIRRIDQATGSEPEPVNPVLPEIIYAVRMSLPEPIGLADDVMAGLGRLLKRLCEKLERRGFGARRLRFTIRRTDHSYTHTEIGLMRPMSEASRIISLFEKPVSELDAGFGIDWIRLHALQYEPITARQITTSDQREPDQLDDLLSRIGNRIGFENLIRFLPAESHIPEKSFTSAAAAFSSPATNWPWPKTARPITLFDPEPLLHEFSDPPRHFHWRAMAFTTAEAIGPERITPEWWLDDPAWRTGLRDYWRIITKEGPRLWLFCVPQSRQTIKWFVQGIFP